MTGEHYRVVGSRPPRYDAPTKVTGQAIYGTDATLPGMIYGRVLRSPHAHARIRAIDTRRAEALPGVYAVVTAADLALAADLAPSADQEAGADSVVANALRDNTLASDKVLYQGHAVAAVAARTPTIAEQACDLIAVDYEVLPAVMDVVAAMQDDAPCLHLSLRTQTLDGTGDRPSNIARHFQHVKGDPAQGFAEADVVIEREFRTAMVHQGYIEPHAATAVWGTDGIVTVYTTTQGSFAVRDVLAELLDLPMSNIRVVPLEVGGAFGGKNLSYVDTVAALLSRKAGGRPVRLVMSRVDVLRATGPTSGTVIRLKVGARRDGKLTAVQATLIYEAGAYPGSPVGSGAGVIFAPYDIPHGQIDGYDVVVNKPRVGSYRAPGATPANYAMEQVMDEIAVELALDPLAFRRLNCAQEGTQRVTGAVHRDIGAQQVLEAAQNCDHYRAPLAAANQGRGVAFAYWGNWGARSSSTITVNADGTVSLVTGSVDITGTRTSLAMQVAEVLGLDLAQVKARMGDTDDVGYTDVSAGSRTTMATGISVVKAARDVVAQMRERAALIWSVPVDAVAFDEGTFTVDLNGVQRLTFAEVAAQLSHTGGAIIGVGNVDVQEWGAAFGAHIADVEVDPETGKVTLLRYTVVQDVGHAIHPTQVEGQLQGGAVQGIGWALYEGYSYDEEGHLLNPTLLDYKLPTALDVPPIETILVEVPYAKHPFGVRGVGENPIMPPPAAIANAISQATGARVTTLPMTPARILESMGLIEAEV